MPKAAQLPPWAPFSVFCDIYKKGEQHEQSLQIQNISRSILSAWNTPKKACIPISAAKQWCIRKNLNGRLKSTAVRKKISKHEKRFKKPWKTAYQNQAYHWKARKEKNGFPAQGVTADSQCVWLCLCKRACREHKWYCMGNVHDVFAVQDGGCRKVIHQIRCADALRLWESISVKIQNRGAHGVSPLYLHSLSGKSLHYIWGYATSAINFLKRER